MIKVKRDTTRDLFNAVLQLVKDNGCYEKAEAIMDYVLPSISTYDLRKDIELSNYEFDFYAATQFGGNEGIYIDCWIYGEYSEKEIKFHNRTKGTVDKETRRSIGTFKTLRTDLEAMQIMGELCGSLVFYASQYVNEHIDRYSPIKELEWQARCKKCEKARCHFTREMANKIASVNKCEPCADKACRGKRDGCSQGIYRFITTEISKHSSFNRYKEDNRNQFFDFLDGEYNATTDYFSVYVTALTNAFSNITIYQAIAYVFVWLCTRKQDFTYIHEQEEE